MRKTVKHDNLVRVIRTPSDASRDYYIPAERAKQLYNEGKLHRCQVYANTVDYCTPKIGETIR